MKFVTKYGLDMREEIRRERTIELCFEANRYDEPSSLENS